MQGAFQGAHACAVRYVPHPSNPGNCILLLLGSQAVDTARCCSVSYIEGKASCSMLHLAPHQGFYIGSTCVSVYAFKVSLQVAAWATLSLIRTYTLLEKASFLTADVHGATYRNWED